MRPISLTLKNVGPHSDVTVRYTRGILGVVGSNGVGKSVISTVAPLYALTGTLKDDYSKSDLLKWGEYKGYVEFVFQDDSGNTYTVHRNVHNTKAKMVISTGEEIRGNKAINVKIEEAIGVPLKVFAEICFISQGTLTNILTMTNSQRLAMFQRLTGTSKADALRTILQAQINNILLFDVSEDTLKDAEKDYSETVDESNAVTRSLTDIKTKLAQYTELLDTIRLTAGSRSQEDVTQEVSSIQADIKMYEHKRLDILSKLPSPVEDVSVLPEDTEMYHKVQQVAELTKEMSGLQVKLNNLGSEKPTVELDTFIDAARDKLEQLLGELKGYEVDLKIVTVGTCPTCNRPFEVTFSKDEAQDKVDRQRARVSKVRDLLVTKSDELKEILASNANIKSETKWISDRIASIQLSLNSIKVSTSFNIPEYLDRVAKAKLYREYIQEYSRYESEIGSIDKNIQVCKENILKLADNEYPSMEEIRLAKSKLESYREYEQKAVEIATRKDMFKRILTDKVRRIGDIHKSLETNSKRTRILQDLTEARDLLHRNKIPRYIMLLIRDKLNKLIEQSLASFTTGFTAYFDEEFNILYNKQGFEGKHVSTLSGGQKTVLALSVILAIAKMFNTPMLILDEPTYGLDTQKMDELKDVLDSLRLQAEKSTYITLVTHEEDLKSTFTDLQIID